MQRFDRSSVPVPRTFSSQEAKEYRERFLRFYSAPEKERAQQRPPEVGRWLYSVEFRRLLEQLFHGKCAFCEQRTILEITRFRPATEAVHAQDGRNSHLYYSWMAAAWENFYTCCPNCHYQLDRRAHRFPLNGAPARLPSVELVADYVQRGDGLWGQTLNEDHLLLDPCSDIKFYRYLSADMRGIITSEHDYGTTTIEYFDLNRRDLIERRCVSFESYRYALLNGGAPLDFQSLEFGGLWYLILRRYLADQKDRQFSEDMLEPETIGDLIRQLGGAYFASLNAPRALPDIRAQAKPVEPPPLSPRRITQIEIKNYKAISTLKLALPQDNTDEQPALLILGENSAGKSTILEAIALALCEPRQRAALDLKSASLMQASEYLGATKNQLLPASVTVSFAQHPPRIFSANVEGMSGGAEDKELPVFAYGAFRQYLDGRESQSVAKSIITLFKSDEILTNPERWLLGRTDSDFAKVVRALREIFSFEQEFNFLECDQQSGQCFLMLGAGKTPLSQASSGYRSLLGMLCEIMQGLLDAGVSDGDEAFETVRAVVLIDEVEVHLHPRWKMQVMSGLRRALPSVTFIATTHDPLCLRGMKTGEAVVVRRSRRQHADQAGRREQIELLTSLPDLSKLSVEQLLTSDFFGLFSTEDPAMERIVADLSKPGLTQEEEAEKRRAIDTIKSEIADFLPIGNTVTEQLIEDALLIYLQNRRQASAEALKQLNDQVKKSILDALEGI